jgi:hypothetical protein
MPKLSKNKRLGESTKDKILTELKKAGSKGIKVRTLIKKFGSRAPARIYDLRNTDGINVVTEPSRGPNCVYVIKDGKSTDGSSINKPNKRKRAKRK